MKKLVEYFLRGTNPYMNMLNTNKKTYLMPSLFLGLMSGSLFGQAVYTVSFDESSQGLQHGSQVNGNEYVGVGPGVTLSISNAQFNQHIIFDTNQNGTADPDLEGPYSVGNAVGTNFNNVLIIPQNITDANGNGLIDSPNDHHSGGRTEIAFGSAVNAISFALIDVEGTERSFFDVTSSNGQSTRLSLADFQAIDSSIVYGDNSANNIALNAADVGLSNIQAIELAITGSFAIDNIKFTDAVVVPEPSSLALLGLCGLGLLRRKRA